MSLDLNSILQQYLGNTTSNKETDQHFDAVSQNLPAAQVSEGVSAIMRSDQTPAFAQLVAQLFDQASPEQQAEMLRQLTAGMTPQTQTSLANNAQLSPVLTQLQQGDLSQLNADHVQQMANQAQQDDDSIIEKMSSFYAEHSGLIKTLGSAALTIGLAKIANNMKKP